MHKDIYHLVIYHLPFEVKCQNKTTSDCLVLWHNFSIFLEVASSQIHPLFKIDCKGTAFFPNMQVRARFFLKILIFICIYQKLFVILQAKLKITFNYA